MQEKEESKQRERGRGPPQQEGQKGDHTTKEEEGPQRDGRMPHVWQGNPVQAEPPRPHPRPARREISEGALALPYLQKQDLRVTGQPQGPQEQEAQGTTLRARPIENIPAGTIGDDKAGVFPGSPPLDGSQGLRRVPEKGSPACPGSTGASRAAMLSMPPKTLRVPLWPLQ